MTFNEYQTDAVSTAIYGKGIKLMYPALGLCGEAGEVANKIKKIFRDQGGAVTTENVEKIEDEMGDVLWYLAALAHDLGTSLDYVANKNIKKLNSRKLRGTIKGDGDTR